MTPILFEKNTTNFTTQGIGQLAHALSCVVKEKRNGLYELEMKYPMDGIRFDELKISRIIYAVPQYKKDPQPFRIYAISKPLNGIVTVNAEHISYQLSFIPVKPFTATDAGQALGLIKTNSMENNPFTFETDLPTVSRMHFEAPTSARALLGGSQGSVLDVFGGEYEFDGYNVILHNHRGVNRGVEIRYGKNLVDLEQEESIENTITGIVPIWSSEDRTVYYPTPIESPTAANFPFKRTIVKDFSQSFDNEPTLEQLKTAAEAYISQTGIGVPKVSLKVEFVHLAEFAGYEYLAPLEQVNLCDEVKVVFDELGVDVTAKVIETDFDVLKNQYVSIKIGSERPSLSKTITEIQESAQGVVEEAKSAAEKAVEYVTEILTGSKGGYKKDVFDADGKPQYTLYMDTEDERTATKVLKISKDGIGFSNNGINGPFRTAWLLDGTFIADNITAGTLLSPSGLFELDMVTGKVKMKDAEITGGSIKIDAVSTFFDYITLNWGGESSTMSATKSEVKSEETGKSTRQLSSGFFVYTENDGTKQNIFSASDNGTGAGRVAVTNADGSQTVSIDGSYGLHCNVYSKEVADFVFQTGTVCDVVTDTCPMDGYYIIKASFKNNENHSHSLAKVQGFVKVNGQQKSVCGISNSSGSSMWQDSSAIETTWFGWVSKGATISASFWTSSTGSPHIHGNLLYMRIG